MKRALCIILVTLLCLSAVACGGEGGAGDPFVSSSGADVAVSTSNLMAGLSPAPVESDSDLKAGSMAMTDFGVRLLKSCDDAGNVLLSPLSVMCALAMTANGADNTTGEQMESVLGMSTEELNRFMYSYVKRLPEGEKYKLRLANSIWAKEDPGLTVSKDFLQTNADYYGADAYGAPFNDDTVKDINDWVNEGTDGMIPELIDGIDPDTVMFLINALCFDAEWANIYSESDVTDGKFTCENGAVQDIKLMHSEESAYLEDENATGFIKYYSGGKYAFAALLPEAGVSVSDYVSTMTGERLYSLLSAPQRCTVMASMPKFRTEYSVSLVDPLSAMGMSAAFDSVQADFSRLGQFAGGNIYIGDVLHKTYISVNERGTRAGAVTAVIMDSESCIDNYKVVRLDRPFVYMLIDCETSTPFFIGTAMSING